MTGRRTATALRAASTVVGAGLFALLVARIGWTEIVSRLSGVGSGMLWLFAAYAAGTAVGGVPWWLVLPRAARPRVGAAIASRFAASGVNALIPIVGVGGEPCRLLWVGPHHRAAAAGAIALDRALFMAASGIFLAVGVAATLAVPRFDGGYQAAALAVALITLVGAVALGVVVARRGLGARVEAFVSGGGRAGGMAGVVGHAAARRESRPRAGRGAVVAALALHVCGRALLAAEVAAALWLLGADADIVTTLVLAAVPVALGAVGWLVPSQLGVQEGAQALVCAALGLDPALGVAVVLLQRIRQVVFVMVALALLVERRRAARRT
jgi:hypothetical protein